MSHRTSRPASLVRQAAWGAALGCALAAAALALEGCRALGLPSSYDTIPDGDIQLKKLSLPAKPPEIAAKRTSEIAAAAEAARPARLASLDERESTVKVEGPQLPLFFESVAGRAFLRSGPGRAMARGAPAESCPAFGAAVDRPSVEKAVEDALAACLEARPASQREACSCQLMAAGDALLAPREAFEYARAVTVKAVLYPVKGAATESLLIAEERVGPELDATPDAATLARISAGERRLWLLDVAGPVASLDLEPDGSATLRMVAGGRDALTETEVFSGRWKAEGFRRGRRAGEVALIDAKGRKLSLLLGYEPAELKEREATLEKAALALFTKPTPLTPPAE